MSWVKRSTTSDSEAQMKPSLCSHHYSFRSVFSVTVIVVGNEIGDPSLNPRRDCVLLHTNSLGKGMNSSVPLVSYEKIVG